MQTKETIQKIIKMYEDGATPKQIAPFFNLSHQHIYGLVNKYGKPRNVYEAQNLKNSYITREYLENLCLEYPNSTHKNLAKIIGINTHTLIKLMRTVGFRRTSTEISNVMSGVYSRGIDENYFETIDTEEKAYIIGMLAADGHICSTNNGICLQLNDEDVIEKISKILNLNYKTRKNNKTGNNYFLMRKSNWKWKQDLISHGIVEKKSLILAFPTTIPEHLMRHFIRGYFDGDGSISLCINKKTGRKTPQMSVVSSISFLEGLKKIIFDNIGAKLTITNKGKYYTTSWGGIHVTKKFYDYLYKDSTIFMDRKKLKFEQILLNWKTTQADYTNLHIH